MRQLTDAELAVSAREIQRDTAARAELTGLSFNWFERTICGLSIGAVVYLSGRWHELPITASVLLTVCAGILPYFYFEVRRLRKQVNALNHLVMHSKRSDA
jgi:hypothetical protein